MSDLYWRIQEAQEEEQISPFSRAADHADQKLEGNRLRRIMAKVNATFPQYEPYRR